MSEFTTSSEKNIDNATDKKYRSHIIGIIQWGEFCLQNIINEANIPFYQDYIRWLRRLADECGYHIFLPFNDDADP